MSQASVQIDPLNSSHPVPWNWILATQAAAEPTQAPQMRYYRSQSLLSPDGQYAAYSRIQMQVHTNMGEGTDTIVDFERGEDAIGLAGRLEFGQLSQSQRGDDLLLGLNAETLAILQGIKEPLTAVDFVAVI